MYRFSIPAAITLAVSLLILGGCAGKTAGDAVNQPLAVAGESSQNGPAAALEAGVLSEPVAAPPAAMLSTLDGRSLETVYFDYDAFTLSPEARRALERNAAWLKANPTVKVTVEGHCDERGSDEYNLALGERRALAVKNYLVTLGISEDRLAAVSYGEERPAAAGHDETAWAKNRRGEFR